MQVPQGNSTMRFTNKIAVVTGGARDIGKAIVLKLTAEGARVAFNYFGSSEAAAETLAEVEAAGGEAIAVKGDMTLQSDVDHLMESARGAFGGRASLLVNVAGGMVARKTLAEMDEGFFEQVMRLNLTSTFLVTKAAVAHMESGAAIVNLSSQAGKDGGGPGASAYATAKGALMTFTKAMAKELGPQGIRVNALCPGMISTSFHDTFSKDEVRARVAGMTPLRREGMASEIADAVAFLLSDEASFLTGVNVDINGGLLMS